MRKIEKLSIKRKAKRLYEKNGGYSAVIELANEKGLKYGFCMPCDNDMPNMDGECLVCGSLQQNENRPVLPKRKRK
jgi:hypothetical protein